MTVRRLWLLVVACGGDVEPSTGSVDSDPTPIEAPEGADGGEAGLDPSPCARPAEAGLVVDAPADGGVVRGVSTPVVVRITGAEAGSDVRVCLDGLPVARAWPEVRRRSAHVGGEWDIVAGLRLLDVVEPGEHRLDVIVRTAAGRTLLASSTFEWRPRPHRVDVETVDGQGRPVAARVHVLRDGIPVSLGPDDGAAADPYLRDVPMTSFFVLDGAEAMVLDPGTYRLVASRSVRDGLGVAEITVPGASAVRLVVEEEVPTPERVTADLHLHTAVSYDAFLPHDVRFGSLLAAGIDVAVITDHNRVVDPGPYLADLGGSLARRTRGIAGIEVDVREKGVNEGGSWDLAHLNVFPVRDASVAPFPDLRPETLGGYYDALRQRQLEAPLPESGSDALVQLNHPRGIHFVPEELPKRGAWPLFQRFGFDPALPVTHPTNAWLLERAPGTGTTALDVDAMEILNRFSLPLYLEVREDWFSLWNQGYRITGTGNSDSHALQVEIAGLPVNLVRSVPPTGDEALDVRGFLGAIREGDVLVSSGPVVELELRGASGVEAGPGGQVKGARVEARVRVRAASWVPVDEVRLVHDGVVVGRFDLNKAPSDTVLDWTHTWTVELEKDGWLLAEAGHSVEPVTMQPMLGGDYGVVARGYVPLGFTNPVRVDQDEDGAWTPPGLF